MWFEILGTISILVVLYLIKEWYIVHVRLMKKYAKDIESRGYRVQLLPYNPFYNRIHQVTYKYVKEGDPLKLMREEYPKYDVIVTNMLNKPFLEFCHPDYIRDFYTPEKEYVYQKTDVIRNFMKRIVGVTLGGSEGHDWKRKRTALNSVFNFDFVKSHIPEVAEICDKTLTELEQKNKITIDQNGDKVTKYHILEYGISSFSKVILSAFLGYKQNDQIEGIPVANYLKNLFDEAMMNGIDIYSMILGEGFKNMGIRAVDREINRKIKLYREWARAYVRKRMAEIQAKFAKALPDKKDVMDILEALLLQKHTSEFASEDHIGNEEQLLSIFGGFFFSGTDTTANYLQMMIYYILKDPEIERKVREDIEKYMATDDYTFQNLKNFKYIDNIQKQVTRMYGPVNTLWPREAKVQNYMNGLLVKQGTVAYVVHFGNHHSQTYFKKPLEFRPDRWDQQCNELPAFVYGGFNAGPRTCIGKHLALIESKVAVIKFFKRYKRAELENKNFKMSYRLVVAPEVMKTTLVLA